MEHEPVLTSEGRQELEEKLQYLETTRRREVSLQTGIGHRGHVSNFEAFWLDYS